MVCPGMPARLTAGYTLLMLILMRGESSVAMNCTHTIATPFDSIILAVHHQKAGEELEIQNMPPNIEDRGVSTVFTNTPLLSTIAIAFFALTGSVAGMAAEQGPSEHFGGQAFDIPDPAQGGRGGQVYLRICAACHDQGLGRAPQRALFVYMSPQSVYRTLTDGKMKAQAQGLSKDDKIAVAEFLTRRKINAGDSGTEPPACRGKAARFDYSEPPIFSGWGFSPENTHFVAASLAGLDKEKVGRLRLKWAVAFPNTFQVRSEPALAGGAVYVGSHNGGVYALDRLTGCSRWIYQAGSEVRTGIVVSPWKAGDRAAKPLIYFGDIAGNVYAVDAQHERLVWRARAEENPSHITGTPSLYGDTLYVPVSSFEGGLPADPHYECCKFRGSVVAYDAATGAVKWKTYMTDPPRLVGVNAKGANQYGPSGAAIWNSPTIDTARKQLYVGTGDNYSSPATNTSDSILALDLATGAVKWAYQGLAGDAMNLACVSEDKTSCPKENGPDLDFGGASAMLVTIPNGRQLVVAGQKSGVVHALDPDTGKLIWKVKPGRGGMLGGVLFGMAANQESVFVSMNDPPDGGPYKESAHPGMYGLDLASGKEVWSAPSNQQACVGKKQCMVGYSQAVTVTSDLLFACSDDGWARILDARSGGLLWQIDTKMPVKTVNGPQKGGGSCGGGAAPILYQGMMFVSSGYSNAGRIPSNLLLAFEAK